MLAPITHILPITGIRRERVLRVSGKVLVRKGQKVSATDIIAEASLTPEHLLIDIARGLGVPASQADKYIKCVAGDTIAEGDILAGPVGLARRVVRTPHDGQVILAGSGQVLIEVSSQPFQLKAGLPGEVTDLIGDRGAAVETTGALIQGVWGNGRIDFGLMSVLAKTPDHILNSSEIDVSLRGSIALAGYVEDAEVIKAAEGLPLRGLILASMSASLASLVKKSPLAVMLTEGFGHRPMNPVAFKLLSTNERHEVALNAEAWDRYTGSRPEVVIPLPGSGVVPVLHETDIFAPAQQVRVLRSPNAGEVGTIVSLKGQALYPTGLRAQSAEIRFESGQTVVIPVTNLEILA